MSKHETLVQYIKIGLGIFAAYAIIRIISLLQIIANK